MSVCFNPINLKTSSKKNMTYRYQTPIYLFCKIDTNKIKDIIKYTLIDINDLSVFGYNNQEEEFWAKKIINNNYLLHFTIKIESYNSHESTLVISSLVGNETEIKKIIESIKEMINLYESSAFIRNCVHNL